jgi:hypothetical protein
MKCVTNALVLGLLGLIVLIGCTSKPERREPASTANEFLESRALALKRFRDFATSVAVTFGEPKGSQVNFDDSKTHFDLFIGQRNVGSAELFERCLASLPTNGDFAIRCFYGVTGKLGKREVSVDPQIDSDGFPISSYEGVTIDPHFKWLVDQVKSSAEARMAIAAAMTLNGCHKVRLPGIQFAMEMLAETATPGDSITHIIGDETKLEESSVGQLMGHIADCEATRPYGGTNMLACAGVTSKRAIFEKIANNPRVAPVLRDRARGLLGR